MIQISIETDNAAFEDNPDEVALLLGELMHQSRDGGWQHLNGLTLRDSNGNTVGKVEIH